MLLKVGSTDSSVSVICILLELQVAGSPDLLSQNYLGSPTSVCVLQLSPEELVRYNFMGQSLPTPSPEILIQQV